jgi:hypothetical protein
MNPKPTRGGKRPGAGRPKQPTPPMLPLTIRVPAAWYAQLKGRGEAIRKALAKLVDP